jgi:hypothetical protein
LIIFSQGSGIDSGDKKFFKLPNGEYRYDYQFLAEITGRDKTILSNKKSPYALQNILGKDKTEWNTKLGGISKGYTYNSISSSSLLKVFRVKRVTL